MVTEIVISREKHYPTTGKATKAAWKWIYTVHADPSASAPDGEYKGHGLGWAERLAKAKANGRPVHRAWQRKGV